MKKQSYPALHHRISFLVFILTAMGLLMSFSTTTTSYFTSGSSFPYREFIKQLVFSCVGFAAIALIRNLPAKIWKKIALPLFFVSCLTLILVLIHPFYVTGIVNEAGEAARRWLKLGPFSFQPSELAKFSIILLLSLVMSHRKRKMCLKDFLILFCFILFPVYLIYLGPNFSAASIVFMLGASTLIVGGAPLRYFILSFSPIIVLGGWFFLQSDRLMMRIVSYQSVFEDPSNTGYQVAQSFIAIARGSLLGKGFMRSSQKFYSLPEAQTDFVFAILCEEFGLIIGLFVISAFFFLMFYAVKVSLKLKDSFYSILAAMIGFHLFLQAMLHIAVTLGFLPPTGIPLPFISIGGTALLVYLIEAGVLIRLAKMAEDKA